MPAGPSRSLQPLALLVVTLIVARAGALDAAEHPSPYAIRIAHGTTAETLRRVLDGARKRLAGRQCEAVLDSFSDPTGRSLRDRLGESGAAASEYLSLIVFYDGSKHSRCEDRDVLAVAAPGSRIVYVCAAQFRERAQRDPFWAEATLIHEALHTLGLGENPPSSQEITSRIIKLCRR